MILVRTFRVFLALFVLLIFATELADPSTPGVRDCGSTKTWSRVDHDLLKFEGARPTARRVDAAVTAARHQHHCPDCDGPNSDSSPEMAYIDVSIYPLVLVTSHQFVPLPTLASVQLIREPLLDPPRAG